MSGVEHRGFGGGELLTHNLSNAQIRHPSRLQRLPVRAEVEASILLGVGIQEAESGIATVGLVTSHKGGGLLYMVEITI